MYGVLLTENTFSGTSLLSDSYCTAAGLRADVIETQLPPESSS
jgi:hypothetical protein